MGDAFHISRWNRRFGPDNFPPFDQLVKIRGARADVHIDLENDEIIIRISFRKKPLAFLLLIVIFSRVFMNVLDFLDFKF